VRVALDTSGAALVAGWGARPDLVRINRDEALGLWPDGTIPPLARERDGLTVVSDGPQPACAWTRDAAQWRIDPPAVAVRNPLGAGDAMLAGLLARLGRCPAAEALRFAAALAGADVESPVAGRPELERCRALLERVSVQRVGAALG
jgi:fructose-1-phosphate kinase PfkB-like protein